MGVARMSPKDFPDVPLHVALGGTPGPHRRPDVVKLVPRWAAPLYLGLVVLLLPWTVYLGLSLPDHTTASHWDAAWVGLDVMEAVAIGLTGWFAYRRSTWVEVSAAVTGALLIVDAWFDCTTARGGTQFVQSLATAVLIELPLAALSFWLARNAEQANEAVTTWLVDRSQRQSDCLQAISDQPVSPR
jgi:hypothetical protein